MILDEDIANFYTYSDESGADERGASEAPVSFWQALDMFKNTLSMSEMKGVLPKNSGVTLKILKTLARHFRMTNIRLSNH